MKQNSFFGFVMLVRVCSLVRRSVTGVLGRTQVQKQFSRSHAKTLGPPMSVHGFPRVCSVHGHSSLSASFFNSVAGADGGHVRESRQREKLARGTLGAK